MTTSTSAAVVDLSHLRIAIQYGAIGWHVLPVKPMQKAPLLRSWQKLACTDAASVRAFWKASPDAGIGVHCGLSGLVVIDVDPRNGGADTLAKIEAEHGPMWATDCLMARTGGGGQHFVFRAPRAAELPTSIGPGVDLLHGHRFFIVEPSGHPSGGAYQWEKGSSPFDPQALAGLPELPLWVGDRLADPDQADGDESSDGEGEDDGADALADHADRLDDTPDERARVRSALFRLSADCEYPVWRDIVFATLATGLPCARDLVQEWSESAPDRFDRRAMRTLLRSFRTEGRRGHAIGPGTLFHLAAKAGWRDPRTTAAKPARPASVDDGVSIVCAADIVPEAISWLWPGWLAAGKLAILAGQPGSGKTTIAIACAAIVSTGGTWPDGQQSPVGDVLIWSGEDDSRDTLVPRLIAAGADRRRVHFVGDASDGIEDRPFDPAIDMPALQAKVQAVGSIRLLIVDPIVSAIAGDSHKNAEVRRALAPLVRFAEECGAALLGISHFTKGTAGRDPLERVTGSVAFGAVARLVWVAGRKENEDGTSVRILARAKSNIGPDDGGHAYSFEQIELPDYPGITASRVTWGQAMVGRARDLLAEREEAPRRESAATWLEDLLSAGPVEVRQIKAKAQEAGHSWRTIERAKATLWNITSKRAPGGNKAPFIWTLDAADEGADDGL